jgi:hypothetical protein
MPARASAVKEVVGVQTRPVGTEARTGLLYPGFKLLAMALTALPATVVGLSAPTGLELVSGIITGLWFALLPAALYRRWATVALPFVAAGLLLFAVFALPFNSTAFIVDFWSAAMMLILALPKR